MDKILVQELADRFSLAIATAFVDLPPEAHLAEVTPATDERFGHYQCNSAMKLAKRLGQRPREVAARIIESLSLDVEGKTMIATAEMAGPGFINITLAPSFLAERLQRCMSDDRFGMPPMAQHKRVLVEYCGVNMAKEMHVGHLRSMIIGECLARVLDFIGYDVLRVNHVGDWGTQFGMLIAYMKQYAADVLSGDRDVQVTQLVEWYREAKKQFDDDLAFKKQAQLEVVALQSGDPVSLEAWERICTMSRIGYEEIYRLLDISLIERGESSYNPLLAEVVAKLQSAGLLTVSDGAQCLFLEGFTNREGDPLPLIVQKSDGGYLYATTDLAAILHRVGLDHVDWIIHVVDAGQATHFAMVFAAAAKAGFYDPSKVHIEHVPFGLVLGPDGKKFRTRSGETERLIDLLDAAVVRARSILKDREVEMPAEEFEETAQALGIGAVKYADLSSNRTRDYLFSYDRMLSLEGNTAAFLLYSYVRINGIKRKIGADMAKLWQQTEIDLAHPSEIALGLHLVRFPETLDALVRDLLPNRLTDYLYALAERFNAFFRDCRVEGTPEQESRLLLCEATSQFLAKGLYLLGLRTVSRM